MLVQSPQTEALLHTGALVGHHRILREITKGTICPIYLTREQHNVLTPPNTPYHVLRLIPLPSDLPPQDYQRITAAIRNSSLVLYDWAISVSEIITNKDSIALVHDLIAGNLLRTMHRSALAAGRPLPEGIAVRIALDLVEGLRRSRESYGAKSFHFHPGSISMGSLYLCSDGKTRVLDGQVMAAVLRSARLRAYWRDAFAIAPELLSDNQEPDERTDVYAIGKVLLELIAGRHPQATEDATSTSVTPARSPRTQVPQRLTLLLNRALEFDPSNRHSTLREFENELVFYAETAATHAEVAEFSATYSRLEATHGTDTLMAQVEGRPSDNLSPHPSGTYSISYQVDRTSPQSAKNLRQAPILRAFDESRSITGSERTNTSAVGAAEPTVEVLPITTSDEIVRLKSNGPGAPNGTKASPMMVVIGTSTTLLALTLSSLLVHQPSVRMERPTRADLLHPFRRATTSYTSTEPTSVTRPVNAALSAGQRSDFESNPTTTRKGRTPHGPRNDNRRSFVADTNHELSTPRIELSARPNSVKPSCVGSEQCFPLNL